MQHRDAALQTETMPGVGLLQLEQQQQLLITHLMTPFLRFLDQHAQLEWHNWPVQIAPQPEMKPLLMQPLLEALITLEFNEMDLIKI
mgnify:CR=1 FL=1